MFNNTETIQNWERMETMEKIKKKAGTKEE